VSTLHFRGSPRTLHVHVECAAHGGARRSSCSSIFLRLRQPPHINITWGLPRGERSWRRARRRLFSSCTCLDVVARRSLPRAVRQARGLCRQQPRNHAQHLLCLQSDPTHPEERIDEISRPHSLLLHLQYRLGARHLRTRWVQQLSHQPRLQGPHVCSP
jgi:hypothetical protein